MFDSFLVQVFIEGQAGKVFEQPAEMVFAESGKAGDIVKAQIFRVMLMDVIADHHKLFGMFFLLGEGGVFVVSHAGKFTAHQDEHLDDPVIDGGADQNGTAEIFLVNF